MGNVVLMRPPHEIALKGVVSQSERVIALKELQFLEQLGREYTPLRLSRRELGSLS